MYIRANGISNEKIFYVYVHKRNDNGSIFYVGKGKGYRSKSKSGRSKHWFNIVNKHGYTIEYEVFDKYSLELIEIAYKDYPRPTTSTKLKFNVNYQAY